MTLDDEDFEHIVEHYHRSIYHKITDYEKVVANKTTTSLDGETLYVFEAPGQTIYLNNEGYPVTIGNQMVDANMKAYYYRRNANEDFEYICPYEWLKTRDDDI